MKDLEQITKRLERLEKQNRQLKRVWVLVIVIVCSLFLEARLHVGQAASSTQKVVEAEQFVLVDSKNKKRAYLTSDGESVRFGIKTRLDYVGDDVFSITYDLNGVNGIKLKMVDEASPSTVIELGKFRERLYGEFGLGIWQPSDQRTDMFVTHDQLAK